MMHPDPLRRAARLPNRTVSEENLFAFMLPSAGHAFIPLYIQDLLPERFLILPQAIRFVAKSRIEAREPLSAASSDAVRARGETVSIPWPFASFDFPFESPVSRKPEESADLHQSAIGSELPGFARFISTVLPIV